MNARRIWPPAAAFVLLLPFLVSRPLDAQPTCAPADIFAVMDQTGARLREINADAQPRIRAKLSELAARRGWSDGELESKGRAVLEDQRTRDFDQRAADLFAALDRLAEDDAEGAVCDRLAKARSASAALITLTQQRTSHALARIDAEIAPRSSGTDTAAAIESAPAPPGKAQGAPPQAREAQPKTGAAPSPRPKSPNPGWSTETTADVASSRTAPTAPPAGLAPPPPQPDAAALGYSPEEIRAAGRGVFGTVSAGLASVIDHAFQRYGTPTGYVLGDEGGAAFFAGLRYGEGRLVTKLGGERRVYWQGPSAGFDFGLAGSRVMFLVYNIDDHAQLFQRFSGIDGSAYLVGGVGITFLKRGRLILAPIRTGLGLRVGASVGYLKFTPTPSLNPF